MMLAMKPNGFFGSIGFCDPVEIRFGRQNGRDTLAHQVMIVDRKNTNAVFWLQYSYSIPFDVPKLSPVAAKETRRTRGFPAPARSRWSDARRFLQRARACPRHQNARTARGQHRILRHRRESAARRVFRLLSGERRFCRRARGGGCSKSPPVQSAGADTRL